MVFPVVMCGCEIWTIKKAERWRIDACELWCWRRLLRVPWPVRESFPRQVDRKSRGPQGERGLEFSRGKKGQTFHSLCRPGPGDWSRWKCGGTLSAPFWCLCQKLSLSPLHFNKTLLHKSSSVIKPRHWPRIEGLNSSPPEAKNESRHLSWLSKNLS